MGTSTPTCINSCYGEKDNNKTIIQIPQENVNKSNKMTNFNCRLKLIP